MEILCSVCAHTNRRGVLFCTTCGAELPVMKDAPHLLVLYGFDRGRTILIRAPSMTLGRDERNDIVLRDPAVSSRHARICFDGRKILIEDLQSRNGTRVNGEKIQTVSELKDEYLVKVGNTLLRVIEPDPEHSPRYELISNIPAEPLSRMLDR